MTEWTSLVQWPAMVTTIAASYLVGSESRTRRNWGFWIFIASNLLWLAWGIPEQAWALVILQVALAVMNIRGLRKSE